MLRVLLCRGASALFEGAANRVVLPSEEGEVSVFDFHAPMLCALGEGVVQIDEARIAVHGGIARVSKNSVTLLVS